MSAKKRKKLRTFISLLVVVALSPLMIMSVISVIPYIKEATADALKVSAELNYGSISFEDDKAEQSATEAVTTQEVSDELPEEKAVFSVDDTNMLSLSRVTVPSSENEEIVVPDIFEDKGPEPYPESLESRDGKIESVCYGNMNGGTYINLDRGGQVRNETDISNEKLYEESKKLPDFRIECNGEPQVLIMHTHTTESFEPYQRDFYDSSFNSRTTDMSMSVVAVGEKIAEELRNNGIGVIHDTTLHDYPSYNGSYTNSRATVLKILKGNPSIKVVLDVHRDAIEKDDGTRIAPTTEIDGKSCAQVMLVACCDDDTGNIPEFMQNFRFASLLEQQLESDYPTLTRATLFDYRFYNQDLTTGSLLVEVGGHANSIEQVKNSGELIGKSLSKALLSICEDTYKNGDE